MTYIVVLLLISESIIEINSSLQFDPNYKTPLMLSSIFNQSEFSLEFMSTKCDVVTIKELMCLKDNEENRCKQKCAMEALNVTSNGLLCGNCIIRNLKTVHGSEVVDSGAKGAVRVMVFSCTRSHRGHDECRRIRDIIECIKRFSYTSGFLNVDEMCYFHTELSASQIRAKNARLVSDWRAYVRQGQSTTTKP